MTTNQDDPEGERGARGGEDTPAWNLVLVHGTTSLLGRRWAFEDGLVLGRTNAALPQDFAEDRKLSREHARFGVAGGVPFVRDLGSRNGTTVNDEPIDSEMKLRERDLVQVGKHVFVVESSMPPSVGDEQRQTCLAARLLGRTLAAQRTRAPLLLVGEPGTGKSHFARAFHAASGRKGQLARLSLARTDEKGLRAALTGDPERPDRPGLFEVAAEGTLLIERWDAGDAESHAWLLEVARESAYTTETRAHGGTERRELSARLIVSVDVMEPAFGTWPTAPRNAALLAAFTPWVLMFPALRERPADAVLLANRYLHELDEDAECADELVMRIAREHWSGNIDELLRGVERSYLEEAERPARPIVLTGFPEDDEPPVPSTPAPKGTRVARDGTWFLTALQGRVDLEERPELAAMLGALASEAVGDKRHLDWRALFEKAWPGEPPQQRAGASRVFVAISALRKLGLDRTLVRHVDGYSLEASAEVCS